VEMIVVAKLAASVAVAVLAVVTGAFSQFCDHGVGAHLRFKALSQ